MAARPNRRCNLLCPSNGPLGLGSPGAQGFADRNSYIVNTKFELYGSELAMRSSLPIVSPTVSQQAMSSPRPYPNRRDALRPAHTSSRNPPPFHNSTATCP
ncbi:hypothetical protein LY76DRAFT_592609 [Colletotrichum caudatum]|nr:hypothetical protein LY76DRAFT_592609 [Colletotrichum caudatum]